MDKTESFSLDELMHIRHALLKAPLPFEQTYPVLMRIESIVAGLNAHSSGPQQSPTEP
jgi:hypothetical protein